MKNIKYYLLSTAMVLPMLTQAQTLDDAGAATGFLQSILGFINGTVIPFILGIAFLFFVYGMFKFFIAGGANEEEKEKGKSLLIYSILGFVLIIVFWGIISLVASFTGLDGQQGIDTNLVPSGPTI